VGERLGRGRLSLVVGVVLVVVAALKAVEEVVKRLLVERLKFGNLGEGEGESKSRR
jgi:hypothetical protein